MALDASQVEALQNSQPPTDWSKFDASLMDRGPGQAGPGMGDDKLHVRFFTKPRIDPAESDKAQRPIYKDTPYVEIMMPGDKHNIVVEPVWEQHKQRFPAHWAQFQAGEAEQVVGTPLKVAPFLTESQVEEMKHFKIRTIEQLAELSDNAMNFMGANEFKQMARKYLEKTKGADALLARIEALEAENARLAAATKAPAAKKRDPFE